MNTLPITTGKNSKYAKKKERMKNGSYDGNSPYYDNIREFQHLQPLSSYPHLRMYNIPTLIRNKDENNYN